MEKLHIEKNTVQETLVIPLFGRKLCSELYPKMFSDSRALKLMERLDYDFGELEKQSKTTVQKYGALELGMRQNNLAHEVREYLKDHPNAAVVNMGCGLDQTGEDCSNSTCKVYNIDMPDVIEIRNQLIPPEVGVTNIACDLTDHSWFDQVDGSEGAVFFAAGVFYYIEIEDVRELVNAMAERFKGGKLVFDTGNAKALSMMMKTVVKQSGIESINAFFHVDSMEEDVDSWFRNGKTSYKGYMTGYPGLDRADAGWLFNKMSKIGDKKMGLKILRFDFDE